MLHKFVKVAIVVAVILVLAGLVFGFGNIKTKGRAIKNQLRDGFEGLMPDPQVWAEYKVELDDLGEDIYHAEGTIEDVAGRANEETARVQQLRETLKKRRGILGKALEAIKVGENPVIVNGKSYSLDQIKTDAGIRLEECKAMEAEVVSHEEAAKVYKKTVEAGKAKLAELHKLYATKKAKMEQLKQRLETAKMMAKAYEALGKIQGLGAPRTNIGRIEGEIMKRVKDAERYVRHVSGKHSSTATTVDWEGENKKESIKDDLSAYLNR